MSERNTDNRKLGILAVPVAASTLVEAGKMAVINANGYGAEGSAALNLKYLGRFNETVDNTAGANGAVSAEVQIDRAFLWKNSGTDPVAQADMMKVCYIEDDQTVSKTDDTGARSAAGLVVGVGSDGVWVMRV